MSSRSSSGSIEFQAQEPSRPSSPEKPPVPHATVVRPPATRPIGKILAALAGPEAQGGRLALSPLRGASGKSPSAHAPPMDGQQYVPIPLVGPPNNSNEGLRRHTPTRGAPPKVPPSRGSPRLPHQAEASGSPTVAAPVLNTSVGEWQSGGNMALSGSVNMSAPSQSPPASKPAAPSAPKSRPSKAAPVIAEAHQHPNRLTIPPPIQIPDAPQSPTSIPMATPRTPINVQTEGSVRQDTDASGPGSGAPPASPTPTAGGSPRIVKRTKSQSPKGAAALPSPAEAHIVRSPSRSSTESLNMVAEVVSPSTVVPPTATPTSTTGSPLSPSIKVKRLTKSPVARASSPSPPMAANSSIASTTSFAIATPTLPIKAPPPGPSGPPPLAPSRGSSVSSSVFVVEEAPTAEILIPTAQHRVEAMAKKSKLRVSSPQRLPVPLQVPTPAAGTQPAPSPKQLDTMPPTLEQQLRQLLQQHGYTGPIEEVTRHRSPPLGTPPIFQHQGPPSSSPARQPHDTSAGTLLVVSPESAAAANSQGRDLSSSPSTAAYQHIPFDVLSNLTDASHLVSSPQPARNTNTEMTLVDAEAIAEEAEDQKGLLRHQLRIAGDHLAKLTRMYNVLNEHNDGIEDEFSRIQRVLDTLRDGVTLALRDEVRALQAEQHRTRENTVAQLSGFYQEVQSMMIRVVEAASANTKPLAPIVGRVAASQPDVDAQRRASSSVASSIDVRPLNVAPARRSLASSVSGAEALVAEPSPLVRATSAVAINAQALMNQKPIDQEQLQEYIHSLAADLATSLATDKHKRLKAKARAVRDHARRLAVELREAKAKASLLKRELAARDEDFALYLRDVKHSYQQQLVTCEQHIMALSRQLQQHEGPSSWGNNDPFGMGSVPRPGTAPHRTTSAPFDDHAGGLPPLPPRHLGVSATSEATSTSLQHATQRILSTVSAMRSGTGTGMQRTSSAMSAHNTSVASRSLAAGGATGTDVMSQGLWAERLLQSHKTKIPMVVDRSTSRPQDTSTLEVRYVTKRAKHLGKGHEQQVNTSTISHGSDEGEYFSELGDYDSCLDSDSSADDAGPNLAVSPASRVTTGATHHEEWDYLPKVPSPQARQPHSQHHIFPQGDLSPQQRSVLEVAAARSAKRNLEVQDTGNLKERAKAKQPEGKGKQRSGSSSKLFRKSSSTVSDLVASGSLPPHKKAMR